MDVARDPVSLLGLCQLLDVRGLGAQLLVRFREFVGEPLHLGPGPVLQQHHARDHQHEHHGCDQDGEVPDEIPDGRCLQYPAGQRQRRACGYEAGGGAGREVEHSTAHERHEHEERGASTHHHGGRTGGEHRREQEIELDFRPAPLDQVEPHRAEERIDARQRDGQRQR